MVRLNTSKTTEECFSGLDCCLGALRGSRAREFALIAAEVGARVVFKSIWRLLAIFHNGSELFLHSFYFNLHGTCAGFFSLVFFVCLRYQKLLNRLNICLIKRHIQSADLMQGEMSTI